MQAFADDVSAAPTGSSVEPPPALALRPFDAARASLAKGEHHVDASPYVPFFEAAALAEPRLLELRALPFRTEEGWARPNSPHPFSLSGPPAKAALVVPGATCPSARPLKRYPQLLGFARSWDPFGRLLLARP